MTITKQYFGKGDNTFGHKITLGKKYEVTIIHRRLAPDTWLEYKWVFIDDDGNRDEITHYIIDYCFMETSEWRDMKLKELGING